MGLAVAAIIATMRERGIAEPDILAVVEAAVSGERRSAGAIRQARYREKQKAQTVTSDVTNNVTSDVTEPDPFPPRDINSTPLFPPVSELRSESRPKRVRTKRSYSGKFENEFWRHYPDLTNADKGVAASLFEKLSDSDQDDCCAGLAGFREYCRTNADYRPLHPDRYIKRRRWEAYLGTAQRLALVPSKVWVARGSEQWAAWLKHLGKQSMPAIERNGEYGWNFESEWPPDATVTDTLPLAERTQANGESRTATEREGPRLQARNTG